MAGNPSIEQVSDGLVTLTKISPTIIGAAGQKTDCIEVRAASGELLDVMKVTTGAEVAASGEPAAGLNGKPYWRCPITKTWESFLFRTDVARMTQEKDWGYVKDPDNLFFGFVSYNPPPAKYNDPAFSSIEESPPPDQWWYCYPFMVQSHAGTKFKQDLFFTIFSTWLESYLIVGPANTCVGW